MVISRLYQENSVIVKPDFYDLSLNEFTVLTRFLIKKNKTLYFLMHVFTEALINSR